MTYLKKNLQMEILQGIELHQFSLQTTGKLGIPSALP
jgi:hypothetical protein